MPDSERLTVSASQAPALFNASPYLTKWQLHRWFVHGDELPREADNRMDWGKRLEPVCLQAAAEQLRFEVRPNVGPDGKQVYVRNGVLGCSRDAEIICPDRGPGALEIKVVFDYATWVREWGGGKTPPRHVEVQTQTQIRVGDGTVPFKWGMIAAWCGGEQTFFERTPITDLWTELDTEAAKFLDDVRNDREPDPFGSPMEAPLLAQVFHPVADRVLNLRELQTDDERRAAEKYAELTAMLQWHREQHTGHNKAADKIKAQLIALAKDHGKVLLPHGVSFEVKQSPRAGYTVKPSVSTSVKLYVPETDTVDDPLFINSTI